MQIPSNLKIILLIWKVLAILAIFALVIIGLPSAFVLLSRNNGTGIFVIVLLLIVILIEAYILKICRDLSQGKAKGVLPLQIFAVLNLLSIPLGTILGIFTLVILSSSEVKAYLYTSTLKPPTT